MGTVIMLPMGEALPVGISVILTDSIGNTISINLPLINCLVATISLISLIIFYLVNRKDRQLEIDEEKIRILDDQSSASETETLLEMPPTRPSFLLPCPNFQWPQHSRVMDQVMTRREGNTELSPALRQKLQEAGILRKTRVLGEMKPGELETAASERGKTLARGSIRISFDTFQAKSRPGLETTSSEDESLKTDANNMTMILLGRLKKRRVEESDEWKTMRRRSSTYNVRNLNSSLIRAV